MNNNILHARIPEAPSIDERKRQITRTNIMVGTTAIAQNAYQECTKLMDVDIPESVACIGPNAFKCCEALEGITLPSNIKYVGDGAFACCYSLHEVIYQGVTYRSSDTLIKALTKNGVFVGKNVFAVTQMTMTRKAQVA